MIGRQFPPSRRTFFLSGFLAVVAGWMTVASLLPREAAPVRGSLAAAMLAQDGICGPAATPTSSGGNWGGVGSLTADPDCIDDGAGEEPGNWGSFPAQDQVIQIDVGAGDARRVLEIPALPEAVGQAAGEAGPPPDATSTNGNCGQIASPLDPKWGNVNRWDSQILAAQQQVHQETGVLVPANVIKAIIMIETQGVMPEGVNYAGYGGLMQTGPGSMGASHYDVQRNLTDPGYSIYTGTYDLGLRYLDSGQRPWENVAVGYFSGHYDPIGARDAFNSDYDYQRMFTEFLLELERAGPSGNQCSTLPAVGVASIWGNKLFGGAPPVVSQGFGPTDFSRFVHPEWYSYALAYGFAEPGHTGLDVAIPAGTALYAPLDSTILCAGTGSAPVPPENSCSAFASAYGGPTSGRLELLLPNGDILILGHVNESLVRSGDKVKAGQHIGWSGGFNGDHVHVEYRIRDAGTSAGWRIIDPDQALSGVRVTVPTSPVGTPLTPVVPPEMSPTTEASPMPSPTSEGTPTGEATPVTDGTPATEATPVPPDLDNDGLADGDERVLGTNPDDSDTDDDGLSDGDEVNKHRSNPLNLDGDADGLPDYNEVTQHLTDPSKPDSDGDGVSDHDETNAGTDPNVAGDAGNRLTVDSDADLVTDQEELNLGTDPFNPDSDFDGWLDGEETGAGTDPLDPNSFPV